MQIERTQARGRATRLKIIEAATDLFLELGFYEVTFQQIADRADISQPGIYNHFSDMDEIILAACKHWDLQAQNYMYRQTDLTESAPEQIRNYVNRVLRYTKAHRSHDSLLIGLFYYSIRSKPMFKYYQELTKQGRYSIEKIVLKGNDEGHWQVKDTADMAEFIHSLMLGEVFKMLIEPRRLNLDERVASLIEKIMRTIS